MKKIYIAGKYNDENVIKVMQNIRQGIALSTKVLKQGDIPFCPFFDFMMIFFDQERQLTSQNFRDYSMEWLKCCEEVWFLPSWIDSGGCRAEMDMAMKLGLEIKFVEGE